MNIFAPGGAWPRLNGVPGSRSRFGSRNFWKDFHHFKVEQNWTFGFIASGKKTHIKLTLGIIVLKFSRQYYTLIWAQMFFGIQEFNKYTK